MIALIVVLVLGLILGYLFRNKQSKTIELSNHFMNIIVISIIFVVGIRAGNALNDGNSSIFVIKASLLFALLSIALSLVSGIIIVKTIGGKE